MIIINVQAWCEFGNFAYETFIIHYTTFFYDCKNDNTKCALRNFSALTIVVICDKWRNLTLCNLARMCIYELLLSYKNNFKYL